MCFDFFQQTKSFKCSELVAGFLLAVLPSGGAQAQREIPKIVLYANQVPSEASRVGSSVTVISGEELREKGVQTVAEALRSVPSVAVTQSGGRGTLTEVRIRGDEANHLMVLIDGIESNSLGDGGFDFADFPVEDVERIEVIRGPQSGLYGANAQSGVISVVTRSGKNLVKPVVEAKVETGTQHSHAGSVNARGALGPAYGSVTVSDHWTRGYNISRFGWEPDGARALVTTAKGGIDLIPELNIEGVVRSTKRSVDSDPQDFGFGDRTFGFVIDGNARTTYESINSRLGATLKLFDGHWIQSVNVKRLSEEVRGLEDELLFAGNGTRTTYDYKSTFLLDSNIAGGERHSITVLLDRRLEDFDFLDTSAFGGRKEYHKRRDGIAGEYVLDLPTATTISAALRRDDNSAFENANTWRFALSQRFPDLGTRIHASRGKGITDPTSFELFGYPGPFGNLPNPALVPEQSVGWDAGIEQRFWDDRVVVDVTYFSTDFTNKIEFTFDPATFTTIYQNGVGTATRKGWEVSNTVDWSDWLKTTATYTLTDAHDSLGMREIRRPPHSASFDATVRFPDNATKGSVGIAYNSVRRDFFFQPTGTQVVDLPSATVVRAMLSRDLPNGVTAYVRAENIFNKQYEEIFSYQAPGFAAYAGLKARL